MTKIVSFPRLGEYTNLIQNFMVELDIKSSPPPPISERTIKFGCKHSADMICFPYKLCLGNLWEALEQGANTLLMWDTKGQCRLRHYYKLQEHTLKNLGYNFEIYPVRIFSIISILKKLNPDLTVIKILKSLKNFFNAVKRMESNKLEPGMVNIGIIGEIYTCLAPEINYDIVNKIKKEGVNAYNTISILEFLKDSIKKKLKLGWVGKRKYKQIAKKYLNGSIGGHGFENIYNLLELIDNNIDGVIHILPLSCMPESSIESIINDLCAKNDVPLLRLPIDETNSEANVNTRLETFIELIKRKNN